jgi:hypothetical protein
MQLSVRILLSGAGIAWGKKLLNMLNRKPGLQISQQLA